MHRLNWKNYKKNHPTMKIKVILSTMFILMVITSQAGAFDVKGSGALKNQAMTCSDLDKHWKNYNISIKGANTKISNVVKNACITALGTDCRYISGYRSPAHNRAVGGAKHSQHMLRKAIDLVIPAGGIKRKNVLTLLICGLGKVNTCQGGMGIYRSGSVHVDVRSGRRNIWSSGYHKANIPGNVKSATERQMLYNFERGGCGKTIPINIANDSSESQMYGQPDMSAMNSAGMSPQPQQQFGRTQNPQQYPYVSYFRPSSQQPVPRTYSDVGVIINSPYNINGDATTYNTSNNSNGNYWDEYLNGNKNTLSKDESAYNYNGSNTDISFQTGAIIDEQTTHASDRSTDQDIASEHTIVSKTQSVVPQVDGELLQAQAKYNKSYSRLEANRTSIIDYLFDDNQDSDTHYTNYSNPIQQIDDTQLSSLKSVDQGIYNEARHGTGASRGSYDDNLLRTQHTSDINAKQAVSQSSSWSWKNYMSLAADWAAYATTFTLPLPI